MLNPSQVCRTVRSLVTDCESVGVEYATRLNYGGNEQTAFEVSIYAHLKRENWRDGSLDTVLIGRGDDEAAAFGNLFANKSTADTFNSVNGLRLLTVECVSGDYRAHGKTDMGEASGNWCDNADDAIASLAGEAFLLVYGGQY